MKKEKPSAIMANTPKPKDLPFWDLLTESQQKLVYESCRTRVLNRRELLYTPDKVMHSWYFVVEGRVKVCRYFEDFREMIVDLIPSDKFVSFQPIVQTPDEFEYAEVVLRTRVIQFDARLMNHLMDSNNRFASHVMQQLTERYNKVVSRLSLVHPTVLIHKQVVTLILELAKEFGRTVGDETIIEHGLSHQEIAAMIHRSRQSVTGTLRLLKEKDLINYTRTSILIRDIRKLSLWKHDDLS